MKSFVFAFLWSVSVFLFAENLPTYSLCDSKHVPLDHQLVEILSMNNGVFIEAGAYNGVHQSNTKLLEDCFGWTGILIEPSAPLYDHIIQNRPNSKVFCCALGSFKQNNTYIKGDFDGYSPMNSVQGKRLNRKPRNRVLVRSLQSILDEVKITHVNFFSLDTEGYEYNILQGIDFNRTTFDYLLIETYPHEHDKIVQFLDERGYDLVRCLSNYNKQDIPNWDGTHNDYLFKRRSLDPNLKHYKH